LNIYEQLSCNCRIPKIGNRTISPVGESPYGNFRRITCRGNKGNFSLRAQPTDFWRWKKRFGFGPYIRLKDQYRAINFFNFRQPLRLMAPGSDFESPFELYARKIVTLNFSPILAIAPFSPAAVFE
jgi:hypothetical protein